MTTFLIFFLVLSVLVLIHELGHFLAARFFGIKVEEFAFGLPFTKPLLQIERGETKYSLYPLLFGGFVRLYGEENPTSPASWRASRGEDFWSRGRKQRLAVIAAGVIMNIMLALVGFIAVYAVVGVPVGKSNKVTIVAVEPGSPADAAGLKVNDRVTAVEDRPLTDGAQFTRLMRTWGGLKVNLTVQKGTVGTSLLEGIVERDVSNIVVEVVPRLNPPEGQGPLGVRIGDFPYLQTRQCSVLSAQCLTNAIRQGVLSTGGWIAKIVEGLRTIGKSLVAGKAPEGVAGPIGIYQLTDVVSQGGLWPIVELTAVLSVNLAVFNILPIPALDGGRMFFIWLEWIRRKRMSTELEQKINSWGMAALIALLILISFADILRLR